jgi:drug/metabolite transporter (DMT)-like permease
VKTKAILYIILAGVLWGTSGLFVHYLSPYGFSSLQMTAVRATVSLVIMALFLLIRNRQLFKIKPTSLPLYAGTGATMFFAAACYYASIQLTSVSTAVVLMYASPIYVMLFSVLFLKEKFTGMKALSIGCMLTGCVLVSGVIGGLTFNPIGILLGVLSGLSYAANNILTKIAMNHKHEPLTVNLYSFFGMALIALSVCQPASLIENAAQAPARTIPLMIGMGVVTFIMPYFLFTQALKELPAGIASTLSIVEPMAATVFSILILHEKPTVFSVVGILLILLAVFLIGKTEGNDHKGVKKHDQI